MSYTYTPGQPVSVLLPSEPADSEIIGASADESLRQIKAYLKDPTAGPEARYVALKAQFDALIATVGTSTAVPPGFIFAMGRTSALTGWLLCDGSTVSRTTYAALFAVVGVNFGAGDGSTTFTLPNLKGRIPVAYDRTLVTNPQATVYAQFGSNPITLTSGEMAVHTHKWVGGNNKIVIGTDTPVTEGSRDEHARIGILYTGVFSHPAVSPVTQSTGGGGSHNNLMKTFTGNYFIKT